MASDRMFQVIVLGGLSLVGIACGSVVSDAETGASSSGTGGPAVPPGGSTTGGSDAAMDASADSSAAVIDASADAIEEFPQEGPVPPDAGPDAQDDAGTTIDVIDASFPQEAPK